MKIGQKIKQRRVELKMSQAQLARKLDYKSRSSINKIELGYNDITQSKVVEFAQALRTSPAFLMGWEEDNSYQYDCVRISPYQAENHEMVVNDNHHDLILPGNLFENRKSHFYCKMDDNSMIDEHISNNDLLIFTNDNKMKNGNIGYFQLADHDFYCRKYYLDKQSGTITLLAANNKYQPITLNKNDMDLKILGKLDYVITKK